MIVVAGNTDTARQVAADLADRLGPDARFDSRSLGDALSDLDDDCTVVVLLTPIEEVLAALGPRLSSAEKGPDGVGVVAVDENGRHVVVLVGGSDGEGHLVGRRVGDLVDAAIVVGAARGAKPDRVIGVGCAPDVTVDEIVALLPEPWRADCIATIDVHAALPALQQAALSVGLPVVSHTADELASVALPVGKGPQAVQGTPSVSETAALAESGADALLEPRRVGERVTAAVAARDPGHRRGRIDVVEVSVNPAFLSVAARRAIRAADHVVGMPDVVARVRTLVGTAQVIHADDEDVRSMVRRAVFLAAGGDTVALASDTAVRSEALEAVTIGMADGEVAVSVVPSVAAYEAAAARLGVPLGDDHMVLSLGDDTVPWGLLERRVRAAAEADVVTVFLESRSEGRPWLLGRALELLAARRAPGTPVGMVTNSGNSPGEVVLSTLAEFETAVAGPVSIVVVGSGRTALVSGHLVSSPPGTDDTKGR